MAKEYIKMLQDSLNKKEQILKEILALTNEQADIVKADSVDWDKFAANVDKKDKCIEEINALDDGFDTLYNRVKDELHSNMSIYKGQIATMQVLIKSITELSADIETTEKRNKGLIENKFSETKRNIKQSKLGNKAAAQYYQKMSRINTIDPQLMDKKS